MWKKIANPDLLIFLDASFETTLKRKRADFWLERDYLEQNRRLSHAREHADLQLATDELTPQDVLNQVWQFLQPYLKHE